MTGCSPGVGSGGGTLASSPAPEVRGPLFLCRWCQVQGEGGGLGKWLFALVSPLLPAPLGSGSRLAYLVASNQTESKWDQKAGPGA